MRVYGHLLYMPMRMFWDHSCLVPGHSIYGTADILVQLWPFHHQLQGSKVSKSVTTTSIPIQAFCPSLTHPSASFFDANWRLHLSWMLRRRKKQQGTKETLMMKASWDVEPGSPLIVVLLTLSNFSFQLRNYENIFKTLGLKCIEKRLELKRVQDAFMAVPACVGGQNNSKPNIRCFTFGPGLWEEHLEKLFVVQFLQPEVLHNFVLHGISFCTAGLHIGCPS